MVGGIRRVCARNDEHVSEMKEEADMQRSKRWVRSERSKRWVRSEEKVGEVEGRWVRSKWRSKGRVREVGFAESGELHTAEHSEHVVVVDEVAEAEGILDLAEVSSTLEDGFALEDEVPLFVRGGVSAPLEGHDAHKVGVEDGDSEGGRSDATGFEEA